MNWQKLKLGDICTVVRNGASIKQIDSALGIPITRIETIADGCLNLHKLGYANIYDDTYRDYYLQKNDILMSHINSWEHLGKTAKVGTLTNPIIHGMNLLLIRTNSEMLNATYLNYYFKSNGFRACVDKIANQSVNQASFAVTKLKEIEIPLPPLDVQKKIADILDKADTLRRKDAELIKKYDELAQSIFIDMFGEISDAIKYSHLKPLGLVSTFIDYRGKTPEKFESGDVVIITAKNVKAGFFSFTETEYVSFELYEKIMTRGFPTANDILFTTEGATLGNTCRIPDIEKFAVGQRLISIKGIDCTNEYLQYVMCSDYFQKEVQKRATGSAAKGIRSAELKQIIIPVPDLDKQQNFSNIINKLDSSVNSLSITLDNSEQLFQSLLQRAFNGELVHYL